MRGLPKEREKRIYYLFNAGLVLGNLLIVVGGLVFVLKVTGKI